LRALRMRSVGVQLSRSCPRRPWTWPGKPIIPSGARDLVVAAIPGHRRRGHKQILRPPTGGEDDKRGWSVGSWMTGVAGPAVQDDKRGWSGSSGCQALSVWSARAIPPAPDEGDGRLTALKASTDGIPCLPVRHG